MDTKIYIYEINNLSLQKFWESNHISSITDLIYPGEDILITADRLNYLILNFLDILGTFLHEIFLKLLQQYQKEIVCIAHQILAQFL